jgi:hypothetical protein
MISGLYYKHITIVNYDSIVDKLGASLTHDARVIIYDHHMFIVQAIDIQIVCLLASVLLKVTEKSSVGASLEYIPILLENIRLGRKYFFVAILLHINCKDYSSATGV